MFLVVSCDLAFQKWKEILVKYCILGGDKKDNFFKWQ